MTRRAATFIFLGLALAGLGLLILGWFPQEYLRGPIERRLRRALGPGSTIGQLRVVPGKLRADVYGLVIEHPSYRLVVPHARLRLFPGFLFLRPLAFREVVMAGPVLILHPPAGPRPPTPPLRDPLVISHLIVTGGTVTYQWPGSAGERLVYHGVSLRGSVGEGTLDVASRGGEWVRRPHPYVLSAAEGRLRVSSRLDVQVDRLELGTDSSRFQVSGSLGRIGDIRPDLRAEGRLELREVSRFGKMPPMSGAVSFEGRASKEGEEWGVQVTARGGGLRVAGWPLDHAEARYDRGEPPKSQLTLQARLLGGRAETDLHMDDGTLLDGHLDLKGIDIARLRRQGVDLGLPLQGRLSGELRGSGHLRDDLRLRGQVRADGRTPDGVSVKARADLDGRLDASAPSVNADWTLVLDTAGALGPRAAQVEKAHLTARGHAEGRLPPALRGSFEGTLGVRTAAGMQSVPVSGTARFRGGTTTLDLRARGLGGTVTASSELQGAFVRRLRASGSSLSLAAFRPDMTGSADFSLTASGRLNRLSGAAQAQLVDFVWRGVVVGPATARAEATGGRGQLSFEAPQLNATGAGTFDPRAFTGTLTLAQTPLAPLQPLLTPDRPLTGEVSGTVEVTFPWSQSAATVVRAAVQSLAVESGTLVARARRPFTLVAQGDRVTLTDLDIEGPGLTFQGGGNLGRRAGSPMDLRGRLELDLGRLRVPPGWTLAGTISGDVQLRGTLARPEAEGEVALRSVVFQRPGLPLITVEDGTVELAGDVAFTQGLRATWQGGEVNLLGRVPLAAVLTEEQAQRLGIAPAPFDVEATFDLDLASLPTRPGWRMTGTIEGDLIFSGTRQDPRAVGLLTLHGVTVDAPGGPLLAVAEGSIELSDDVASTAGLSATLAGGTLEIQGTLPLAALLAESWSQRFRLAPGEADLRLAWRDVQGGRLLDVLRPRRASGLVVPLAGNATLRGRFTSLDTLSGTLSLEPTTARIQDVDIGVSAFEARLDSGRMTTTGLNLTSAGGTFRADGTLDLRARTVSATSRGQIELRVLSPFLEEASLTGVAQVDLSLEGPLANPRPQGRVAVSGATLRLREIRQPFTEIAGRLSIEQGQVRVEQLQGLFGGGPIQVSGEGRLDGLRLSDVRLGISGQDIGLRYPVGGRQRRPIWEELKARVDADLTLTGRWGDFLLAGTLTAERSLYDADIFLEEGFLPPEVPPAAADTRSAFLDSVALNIGVATENPFLVRNNLAQLEADGALSLRGSLEEPAPFGRFELRPGGKVFLQEREFVVESGSIAFAGDMSNPDIAVRATSVIGQSDGDIQVTVVAEGPLDTPRLTLSSDPSLSEQEIASLIATGRTNVALETGAWIVGEQAAALLAGRFTRKVARELLDLGLDQVDIQPELLAREGEPSARFTIGKQLTRQLRLVYSVSLSDPEAQFYQALFRFRRGMELSTKIQRRAEGGYTYGAGQRLRFGAAPPRRDTELETVQLTDVRFEGGLREFPELRGRVKAGPGDEVTYFDLLDDADRLREHLVKLGYLEAVVDARFDGQAAVFGGSTGARYRWRVLGMDDPPDLTRDFQDALFEEEAADRGRLRILEELHRRRHLRASVEVQSVREEGYRTLVFRAEPGPVLEADVRFPGATALSPSALIEAAGGAPVLITAPRQAEENIGTAYREEHFLAAKVGPVQVTEEPGRVQVVVPVEEGPRAVIRSLRFPGATPPGAELAEAAGIAAGSRYDPLEVSGAVQRLRDLYLRLGYAAVRVVPRLEPVGLDLEVVFTVHEGASQVVGPVRITGLRRTRESWVRSQIRLTEGKPLDPRKLAETERRLRDLGVFYRVVVTASADPVAVITVDLTEDARYTVAYDARYNDEEGISGLVDAEADNLFGRGMSLGGRFRAGLRLREVRASFHVPAVGFGDLTVSAYRLGETVRVVREVPEGTPPGSPFEGRRSEQGFQVQQTLHDFHPWDFLYGYRLKRTTCPEQGLPPLTRRRRGRLFDPCENSERNVLDTDGTLLRPTLDVAAVDLSAIRDTRDNPLNPTRGSFLSMNVQASPQWLGSDFDFLRQFMQVSFLHDVTRSLVWAHGYRVGLIHTLHGERLPYDDLFKAGGPNSVRGYGLDSLGPVSATTGEPLGGQAVLILNQELRYHHQSRFGAAVFYDAGNVFDRVRDVDFKLRHSVGFGLRYDSVIGLVRLDLGFPLDRRAGDKSYQFSFGLGQAF